MIGWWAAVAQRQQQQQRQSIFRMRLVCAATPLVELFFSILLLPNWMDEPLFHKGVAARRQEASFSELRAS
jgi:hypothetical protein